MLRETIIQIFATAMALACSGMVLAADAQFLPHHETARALVVLSGDDEVRVLEGRLR